MITKVTDWSTHNSNHDYSKANVCVKCNHSKTYIEQTKVSCIGGSETRVETGVIQFGDDWPGIFIRGDNALGNAIQIDQVLQTSKDIDPISRIVLENLKKLLMSCANQKVNDDKTEG